LRRVIGAVLCLAGTSKADIEADIAYFFTVVSFIIFFTDSINGVVDFFIKPR
jgi:hypothetical protein